MAAAPVLTRSEGSTLRDRVVAEIIRLIESGAYQPGDRVPSVRKLSHDWGVSLTTVLEAYRALENQGWIEARPQSGFYVRVRLVKPVAEPTISRPPCEPQGVAVSDLISQMLQGVGDPEVVQLGAAVPNPELLPTRRLHQIMASIVRRQGSLVQRYDFPPGCRPLRVQIAQRLVASGCAITPEEIVTTVGCMEALHLALSATCRPGDTVAIESPIFYGVLQAIEHLGLRALEIPAHPRTGLSLEALRLALDEMPVHAVLTISNFNNPLGCTVPGVRKRDLVELLAAREIPLIEDDLYGNLHHGETRPHTCKAFDRHGLVLLCSSFSKELAPGHRVGWIAPGRFQRRVESIKIATTCATPALPQYALAEFLASGGYDHHLRRARRAYRQSLALMAQAVAEHFPEGTCVTQPEGGFVLWAEMPEGVDALALTRAAKCERISVAPGPLFSARGMYGNCVRLSAAEWSPRVERAVARLGELAHQH